MASAGYRSDFRVALYWLDSNYKNYQHFDDVIDKVDNPDNQLKGFAHYISENYKLTQNDYHILMTEENWSGAAGMAYMNSHFSMASDDTESTAAQMLIIFIIRI
jgi:hypothetical protein